MFYAIDTQEKLECFLSGLENGNIIIGRETEETAEEREQFSRELAEYRAPPAPCASPAKQMAYA